MTRTTRLLRQFVLDYLTCLKKPRPSPSGLPKRKTSSLRTPFGWRLKKKRAPLALSGSRVTHGINPPKPLLRAARTQICLWRSLRPCRFSTRVPRMKSWTILMLYDSSALIAVLFEEPEKQAFQDIIDGDERRVLSAVNAHETACILRGRNGIVAVAEFWQWLADNQIEIAPFDEVQVVVSSWRSSMGSPGATPSWARLPPSKTTSGLTGHCRSQATEVRLRGDSSPAGAIGA